MAAHLLQKPQFVRAFGRGAHFSPQATVVPGGYVFVGPAARGASCDVDRIREVETGKTCAWKRIRPDVADPEAVRQRLEAEARVARRCHSRHVARVVSADLAGEQPYLIEEWLDGRTLEQLLNDEGRLPLQRAVWISRQCAQGLGELCQAEFAHGDVRPANIFVQSTGEVKLIGLSSARPLKHSTASSVECLTSRTTCGMAYRAPELSLGGPVDPLACNMYSLGATLYEMLAGRPPFAAETHDEMMRQHRTARPPLLRQLCPEAPPELASLLNRMLAKQPLRRPATWEDVIAELVGVELTLLPDCHCRTEIRRPGRSSGTALEHPAT